MPRRVTVASKDLTDEELAAHLKEEDAARKRRSDRYEEAKRIRKAVMTVGHCSALLLFQPPLT